MLTGAADGEPGEVRRAARRQGRAQHPAVHRRRRRPRSCRTRGQPPWTGDNVFSSGDLVEDLTHNFFLETGARNNKLKVYEMVEHPAARALTGYLLVRGGVHQVAYARALENLTGADLMKLFPSPHIPTDKIPECRPHIKRGEHLKLYRFSQDDFLELAAVFNGPHPETGEELVIADETHPEGAPANDLPSQPAVFAPGADPERSPRSPTRLRKTAGLPKGHGRRRKPPRRGERPQAGCGEGRRAAQEGLSEITRHGGRSLPRRQGPHARPPETAKAPGAGGPELGGRPHRCRSAAGSAHCRRAGSTLRSAPRVEGAGRFSVSVKIFK